MIYDVFLQGLFPDLVGILTEHTYKVKRNLAGNPIVHPFFVKKDVINL
jgi:hypothetical protein